MRGLLVRYVCVALTLASSVSAQSRDSSWLAFRVDSNRVVAFFRVAELKTAPTDRPLTTAAKFFLPVLEIPSEYALSLPEMAKTGHVQIGERMQLSLDSGQIVTVRVTGFAAGIGQDLNDSWLGVVATIPAASARYFARDVYAITRGNTAVTSGHSAILDNNVSATERSRITESLRSALRKDRPAMGTQWTLEQLEIRPFRMAGGARRYFAATTWRGPQGDGMSALTGWFDGSFTMRAHECLCPLRESEPDQLVNVVTLPVEPA